MLEWVREELSLGLSIRTTWKEERKHCGKYGSCKMFSISVCELRVEIISFF